MKRNSYASGDWKRNEHSVWSGQVWRDQSDIHRYVVNVNVTVARVCPFKVFELEKAGETCEIIRSSVKVGSYHTEYIKTAEIIKQMKLVYE